MFPSSPPVTSAPTQFSSVRAPALLVGPLIAMTRWVDRFLPTKRYRPVLPTTRAGVAAVALGVTGPELVSGTAWLLVYAVLAVALAAPTLDAAARATARLALAAPRGEP